jgi:hypothetical protein
MTDLKLNLYWYLKAIFKTVCFLSVLLCAISSLSAQDSSQLHLLKTIDISVRFLEIDRMQQVYAVTDDHTLQKYSADGELLKTFNENSLGAISSLDVTNPFQILVYYVEYQTAVVLDRSLSESYRFLLSDLDLMQIDAVGLSSDNMLWLYNPNDFKLLKIGNQSEIELESPDLRGILKESFQPKKLREAEFKIFLNDPETGIMIFDNFGNYFQTLVITEIDYFQVIDRYLVWMDKAQKLHRMHLKNYREEIYEMSGYGPSTEDLQQVCLGPERMIYRYKNRLAFYKWVK